MTIGIQLIVGARDATEKPLCQLGPGSDFRAPATGNLMRISQVRRLDINVAAIEIKLLIAVGDGYLVMRCECIVVSESSTCLMGVKSIGVV